MKLRLITHIFATLATIILCASAGSAQQPTNTAMLPDSLSISLITCDAGPEIFELYGHEAIRVSGRVNNRPIDEVYNYGVFDFDSPGFIYRFVKGETDYYADAAPTSLFLYSYLNRGSKVTQYPLNISQEEAGRLYAMLRHDVDPRFRTYRYQYFSNNCATRILDNIDTVLGAPVKYAGIPEKSGITCREMLREMNEGYPWYQLGIDLALGSRIDKPLSPRVQAFAPIRLAEKLTEAKKSDGSPLVSGREVIYPGEGDMRLSPTPFYLSPTFIFSLIAVITLIGLFAYMRKNRYPRLIWTLWGILCGVPGCMIWFLIFCTTHEGTSPNYLGIWLNPLWLLLPFICHGQRLHQLLQGFFLLQFSLSLATLAILLTGLQSSNPALMPLLGTTIIITLQAMLALRSK